MSTETSAKGGVAAFVMTTLLAFAPSAALAQEPPETGAAESGPAEAAPAPESDGAPEAAGQAAAPADDRPLPPPPPRPPGSQNYANSGYQAGAPGTYQAPQDDGDGVYRPLSFTLGAGPGLLRLSSPELKDTNAGLSYALRLGFGVQEDLLLTLAFEGSSARKNGTLASQEAWLLGLQYFPLQVLYVRGAMGIVHEMEEDAATIYMDQRGFGLQGALGVDLLQAEHVALSLEASLLHGWYSGETWTGGGLNLLFSIY